MRIDINDPPILKLIAALLLYTLGGGKEARMAALLFGGWGAYELYQRRGPRLRAPGQPQLNQASAMQPAIAPGQFPQPYSRDDSSLFRGGGGGGPEPGGVLG